MKRPAILVLLICVCMFSCSLKRATTTMTAKVVEEGLRAVESESDIWIAKESIIPLVKILEVFGESDPKNPTFLALMSRIYGNVAFGFFEPRYMEAPEKEKSIWLARVERYYRLGYEGGMKSLRDRFGDGIDKSVMDFEAAIGKAKKKDLMLLFWTAFDLGNFVNLKRDDVASVANLPKVSAMVNKVVEINPDFSCGAAKAFQAAMLGSRPKMLGGNPEQATKLFEEAVRVCDGKYLMNKVMYAEWYAIPQGDFKLAQKLLDDVVNADPLALQGQELANQLAIERAQILQKKR